jgi:hypothetical protein
MRSYILEELRLEEVKDKRFRDQMPVEILLPGTYISAIFDN